MTPAITPCSPWTVRDVRALGGFKLAVVFLDGTAGTVEMRDLLESPRAGVFQRLRDKNLFEQVFVDYGAVAWPGELDLAPDAMYDEIRAHGVWRLG